MTAQNLKEQDQRLKEQIKSAIEDFQFNTGITINRLKVKCFSYMVGPEDEVQTFDYKIDFEI